jgi:chromate transport protein ChrA
MRRTYLVGHWLLTLLLAPFTQFFYHTFIPDYHLIAGLLDFYPLTLVLSIAFSLPTFLVYLTCFFFLSKYDVNPAISKLVLIAVSVIGIYITTVVITAGSMSLDTSIAYSLTALIVGLILKLKANKKSLQD